jgi:hypothetical protein
MRTSRPARRPSGGERRACPVRGPVHSKRRPGAPPGSSRRRALAPSLSHANPRFARLPRGPLSVTAIWWRHALVVPSVSYRLVERGRGTFGVVVCVLGALDVLRRAQDDIGVPMTPAHRWVHFVPGLPPTFRTRPGCRLGTGVDPHACGGPPSRCLSAYPRSPRERSSRSPSSPWCSRCRPATRVRRQTAVAVRSSGVARGRRPRRVRSRCFRSGSAG